MKDAYTNWRELTDGDLTATETSGAIKVGKSPRVPASLQITIPTRNADADTLAITFTESATEGGSYALFQTIPTKTGTVITVNGITINVQLGNSLPWVKCVLTVAGSTPNFGKVCVGLDTGVAANGLQVGAA